MPSEPFRFKQFAVEQAPGAYPISTDSVLLGAWAEIGASHHLLDIGTGTGVIALMLAQRGAATGVSVTGVDVLPVACACAGRNFAASPWAGRLRIVESSIQAFAMETAHTFDLIVSNPPYFASAVVSPNEYRRISRSTGELPPGQLLEAAGRLLSGRGRFCVIMPVGEGRQLTEQAACQGLYCTRETVVYSRKEKPAERLLLQFERSPYAFRREVLSIYEHGSAHSMAFRGLTRDFYL